MITGNWKTREVRINGELLDPKPSQRVCNHSPDGFAWGYGGSGPAQLSLAMLMRYTSEDEAVTLYQRFKWSNIANLPQDDFCLPEKGVLDWLKAEREGGTLP